MADIIIIAGSNNKNLELSNQFQKVLKDNRVLSKILDLVSLDIPLYTPLEESKGVPEKVYEYVKLFDQAKGFIFVIPEYNGGIPPVVTSMIAWISRSGDPDWRKSFNSKPTAIASFSGSGGIQALVSLRTQLSYVGMNVIGRQVRGTYKDEVNKNDVIAVANILIQSIER
jgi:chromate reductase